MRVMLLVHILGGALGLLTGYVALYAAKGGSLHRKSGTLFVYAMVVMGLTGAGIAALTGVQTSVMMGLLATYLVITSLTTVRQPTVALRWLDRGAMLLGLAVGLALFAMGMELVVSGGSMRDEMPMPMFFVFGSIALLASISDVRWIRAGGLKGPSRIARHLWRMSFALFIAAASFFLGQADEIPETFRIPALLAIPVLVPLIAMFYWLWRVRFRRAFRRPRQHQLA